MAPSQEELERPETSLKRRCQDDDCLQQKRSRPINLDTQAKGSNPEGPPRCQQCGYQCWLCSVIDGASPGREDPGTLWSQDPESDDLNMKALPHPATGASSSAAQSSWSTKQSKDPRYITTKDVRFSILLWNAGIIVGSGLVGADIEAVLPRQSAHLNSAVSIELSDEQSAAISNQIQLMGFIGYQEFEIRLYLEAKLIFHDQIQSKEDPYSVPEGNNGSARLSLRRDGWRTGRKGPTIDPDSAVLYDFTSLTPDTTYMASMSNFAWRVRQLIYRGPTIDFVADPYGGGCCPYLTIEFKSSLRGASMSEGHHQIAAASAIWLVYRKELRLRVVDAPDCSDLRHYGVIFTPSTIEIWEARMDGDQIRLSFLAKVDPYVATGLREFVRWSNAIHSWGLNENFDSFKADMEAYLRKEGRMAAVEGSLEDRHQ